MKKLMVAVIIFVVITFFVIGNKQEANNKTEENISLNTIDEYRAMFVSYLELEEYIMGQDDNTSRENIITILNNMNENNFNMIILHVRPFSDSIYKNSIFPYSQYVLNDKNEYPSYDVLDFFIQESHKRNIEIHAWINPYRISFDTDVSKIKEDHIIYKYVNTSHIQVIDNKGIFYNPASSEARKLIVNGVEEIVLNYDIDGIHFDDYFYPDNTFDLDEYEQYLNEGGTLSLSDYRLNNTSILIKEVYDAIKNINPNVIFGISPEGNINNNYDFNYIDTKKITSEKGYIDYIMPQIYFGFFNEVMPFIETVNMWNSLIKVEEINIIPALAFYKSGTIDNYAKGGKEEWILNTDIIKRQILISRNLSNYKGFSLFRYDYIFKEDINEYQLNERNNLFSIM